MIGNKNCPPFTKAYIIVIITHYFRDSDGHHNLSSFPHLLPASLARPPPAHPPGWWRNVMLKKTIFKNHTQAPGGASSTQNMSKTLWKIGLQNQTVRRVYMWGPGYWLNYCKFHNECTVICKSLIPPHQKPYFATLLRYCIIHYLKP